MSGLWESMLAASLLGEKWELINTVQTTEDGTSIICSEDSSGNGFELKKAAIVVSALPSDSSSSATDVFAVASFAKENEITGEDYRAAKIASGIGGNDATEFALIIERKAILPTDSPSALAAGFPSTVKNLYKNIASGSKGFRSVGVVSAGETGYFGTGSEIKVYGVKA